MAIKDRYIENWDNKIIPEIVSLPKNIKYVYLNSQYPENNLINKYPMLSVTSTYIHINIHIHIHINIHIQNIQCTYIYT